MVSIIWRYSVEDVVNDGGQVEEWSARACPEHSS